MYKKVGELNLPMTEQGILKFWRENDVKSKCLKHNADKEVFSFVYDYDLGICITMMKPKMEYEVYTIIGILEMHTPEETIEDDIEKTETKNIAKTLKEGED